MNLSDKAEQLIHQFEMSVDMHAVRFERDGHADFEFGEVQESARNLRAYIAQLESTIARLVENGDEYAEQLAAIQSTTQWRPIETAPKDGTRIIVGCKDVVWCDAGWQNMKRVPDRWESFIGPVPFQPTHWMPLPEPPK